MGADAVRIVSKIEFEDVGAKCTQIFELSRKKDYRTKYPWVDNIEPVKNPSEQSELDGILLNRINEKDTDGIYLAPPRIADLTMDEEYRFPFDEQDTRRYDIDFDDLMAGIEANLPIDLAYLKKHRIDVYSGSSQFPVDRFNIYSGIVLEITHKSDLYCLIDADWYKISKSHVKFVNDRIDKIKKSPLVLPNSKKDEREDDYNKRASKEINALCLDKVLVSYGGSNSKIEICDVLTSAPCFIHVKKATSSQVLSHLFSQGVVGGTFLFEEDFRTLCKAKSTGSYKSVFDSPFDPSKATITYALISPKAESLPQSLPFFSKQTLVNAVDLLEKFKYIVDFVGIKVA